MHAVLEIRIEAEVVEVDEDDFGERQAIHVGQAVARTVEHERNPRQWTTMAARNVGLHQAPAATGFATLLPDVHATHRTAGIRR